jgi:endonuclease YncB( thermonuclease family)
MSRSRACLIFASALAATVAAAPARAEWTGPCRSAPASPTCHFWKGKVTFVDDGDTIDVRLPTSTGKGKTVRVRIIGIQAMEQRVYTRNPRKRRGACHALPATARLEQLIKEGHWRVRLSAQNPASASGSRPRRSVAVKLHGKWQDVGSVLLAEGHVLWLPNPVEYTWNATYNELAQHAAAAHLNLWDLHGCGFGPSEDAALRLTVYPDAKGNDFQNVNGEHVTIENVGAASVSLTGWWLRDSSLRKFGFPAWGTVRAGDSITVRVGRGDDTEQTLYWGLDDPIFENATKGHGMGDGAYLFDPQGDLRAWMMYPCFVDCSGRGNDTS